MAKELQKHTLHLRRGDMEFIQSVVPAGKASEVVRKLVSRFVDVARKDAPTELPELPTDLKL